MATDLGPRERSAGGRDGDESVPRDRGRQKIAADAEPEGQEGDRELEGSSVGRAFPRGARAKTGPRHEVDGTRTARSSY